MNHPNDENAAVVPVSANVTSMVRYLGGAGAALWALIMALQPEVGFIAPLPWMAFFWFLQVGVGLVVLQSVFYLLSRTRWLSRLPLWVLVLTSGVASSAVLAPLYWLIGEGLMQHTMGFPSLLDDDGDSGVLLPFGPAALVEEFGDIVGQVTTAWLLISWPRLQGLLPPLILAPQALDPLVSVTYLPEQSSMTRPGAAWRAALPSELGDDLIAVRSELQYLRVWTVRGTALVLGALQDVEAVEGNTGMRVHRSWWVNARHVRGVRRSGDGAVCILSDGREIPVSRRRKAEVLARFGDGARFDIAPAPATALTRGLESKLPPQPDLN